MESAARKREGSQGDLRSRLRRRTCPTTASAGASRRHPFCLAALGCSLRSRPLLRPLPPADPCQGHASLRSVASPPLTGAPTPVVTPQGRTVPVRGAQGLRSGSLPRSSAPTAPSGSTGGAASAVSKVVHGQPDDDRRRHRSKHAGGERTMRDEEATPVRDLQGQRPPGGARRARLLGQGLGATRRRSR